MRRNESVPTEVPGANDPVRPEGATRRPWSTPVVEALPPLSALTLSSIPIPGGGNVGGGGSTVF